MKKVYEAKGFIVKVSTVAKKQYFVEIQAKKDSLEEEMCVKNKYFYFRMKTSECLRGKTIIIRLEKEYNLDSQGNITGTNNATKLRFSGDGYKGSIVLYPKAYIPKNIRKKSKSADADRYSAIKSVETPKKTLSKYVNYSHNNAARPYVGGKVSPK